jgi:hypothetical protein
MPSRCDLYGFRHTARKLAVMPEAVDYMTLQFHTLQDGRSQGFLNNYYIL